MVSRGFSAQAAPLAAGAAAMSAVVPLYVYPASGNADWAAITTTPHGMVIANPGTGPGASANSDYTTAINAARAVGVKVLGYVHLDGGSGPGTRAKADVLADIDTWHTLYAIDGVFLDVAPTGANGDKKAYFAEVCGYARGKGTAQIVVVNPGTHPLTDDYVWPADVVCTWEGHVTNNSYLAATVPGYATWYPKYPASKYLHLVYGVSDTATMQAAVTHAAALGARWCYATQALSWDAVATYWATQVATLKRARVATDPLDRAAHHGAVPTDTVAGFGTGAALTGGPGGPGMGLWTPPRMVWPSLKDTVIQAFQAGHGWNLSGTTGATYEDDTTDYWLGSQSVRLTTGGAGATHEIRSPVLSAMDLSTKNLVLAVKIDDFTNYSDFQIRVSSNGFTDFGYAKPLYTGLTQRWVEAGKWTLITLGRGKLVSGMTWGNGQWQYSGVEGNVDWSAITGVRLRLLDDAAGQVTAKFNLVGHFPQPARPVLCIIFDDGRATHHSEAKRYMDRYRMVGTSAVILNSLNSGAAYMTTQQVAELRDASGWSVAFHACDNADGSLAHANGYDGLTYAAGEDDILRGKHKMHAAGHNSPNIICLPHGSWSINTPGTVGANTDVMGMIRKYFDAARTTYSNTLETYPPADPHRLRSCTVTNTDTAANLLSVVDQGIAGNHLILMQWHNIVDPASGSTDATPAVFQAFIDGIASRVASGPLVVRTLHHILQHGMV